MTMSKFQIAKRRYDTLIERLNYWKTGELHRADQRIQRAIESRSIRLKRAKDFLQREMEAANLRVQKATEWRTEVLERIDELESLVEDANSDLKNVELERDVRDTM